MSYTPQTIVGTQDPYGIQYRVRAIWGVDPATSTGRLATGMTSSGAAAAILITDSPANTLQACRGFTCGATDATLNNNGNLRAGEFCCIQGSASPMGGFRLTWRFGIDAGGTLGSQARVGLWNATGSSPSATANPSADLNVVWLAYDTTDTNWQIMHNDGAGSCTRVDLTSDFAINNTSLLEFVLESAPSASTFQWTIRDLSLGRSRTGEISGSNVPANTTPFCPAMHISNRNCGVKQNIRHIICVLEIGPGAD